MNLIFYSENIGAFLKWVIKGCKNKYSDELKGENEFTHFFRQISVETENMLLGLIILFILILIILEVFKLLH